MEKTDIVTPTYKPAQRTAKASREPSMAQAANIKHLQKGDIPTLANVPGMLASKVQKYAEPFVREAMQQRPNRVRDGALALKDIATGKKPLIGTNRRSQTAK
jgi:hypothetical protein